MANVTGANLTPIYNQLRSAPEYHPLEANTFADWSVEAGDIVTVTRDGRSYKSPVHSQTTNWNKKQRVSVSSTGNEKRESVSKTSQRKFGRVGSGLRASQESYTHIVTSYNQMTAGLELASSSAALYVDNKYSQMRAGLNLTSSSASLYVDNKYSQMKAGLDLTSSSASLYVDNKYSQMRAGLDLTSSSASLYVDNKYTQMSSGLKLTSSSAALYVDNKYTQMSSGLKLTSSSAALYVDNKYTQMSSGLKLSSSSAALYVDNRYTQMSSGLKLTSSSAALYVDNRYTQMSSGLKLTSSSAALYVDNRYTQMSSGLKLTSSSAALYVDNKYTQMSSGLKLTSSSAALYVDNKYTQMSSGLKLTSSSAALYVDNKYTQMSSGLKLTSSSAALYVDNKYTQMSSGLKLSSSSAALYVDNKYTQMSSGLNLTSSSAALYVDSKYNQMKAGLDITSSSAAMYARSAENAAEIVARINEDGEGEIRLDANHVYIGNDKSTTVINGKLTAADITSDFLSTRIAKISMLNVKAISSTGNIAVSNGYIMAPNYYIGTAGNARNLAGGIWTLNIKDNGNNTYTLQKMDWDDEDWVDVGTFSRATSTTLSGSWSGSGTLTVTASPQGEQFKRTLVEKPSEAEWNSDYKGVSIPIYAQYGDRGQYEENTNKKAYINTTPSFNAGKDEGKTTGWDLARGKVSAPSTAQTANAYFDFGVPGEGYNTTGSYRYTVSCDDSYCYIKNAANVTVARTTNTAKQNAWDLARGKVSAPSTAQTANAYFDFGVPGEGYNTSASYRYTVSCDDSYCYIKNA